MRINSWFDAKKAGNWTELSFNLNKKNKPQYNENKILIQIFFFLSGPNTNNN